MNYKETLNLPRTEFPMKANLSLREPEILARWDAENIYAQIQEARKNEPLFVLHDGPPFANGDVHMGTALNKIRPAAGPGRGHPPRAGSGGNRSPGL
jgi:isoleucyl-tRNA synthetase